MIVALVIRYPFEKSQVGYFYESHEMTDEKIRF